MEDQQLVDRRGEWDLNNGFTCTALVDTRRLAVGVSNSTPYARLHRKSLATPGTHTTIQQICHMVNSNWGHTPNAERFSALCH
jgi:hypothetical protein